MSELDPKKYIVGKDATVSDIDLDREAFILSDGRRLNDEFAAEIAARALAAKRRQNLIPGRKSLSGDGKHSPVVQFRLAVGDLEYISRLVERNGQTISAFARQALLDAARNSGLDSHDR